MATSSESARVKKVRVAGEAGEGRSGRALGGGMSAISFQGESWNEVVKKNPQNINIKK